MMRRQSPPEPLKIDLTILLPYFVKMYLVIKLDYTPDNTEYGKSNKKDLAQAHNGQEKLQEHRNTNYECQ
jgi:hypothetical protein